MAQVGEWQHGLCGCFDNCAICVVAHFVPCYQFGKNAEAVGEDCFKCGCAYLIPIANVIFSAQIRGKIREQKAIDGTFTNDLLMVCCCPLCALVQEAQEVQGDMVIMGQAMARE